MPRNQLRLVLILVSDEWYPRRFRFLLNSISYTIEWSMSSVLPGNLDMLPITSSVYLQSH